MRFHPILLAGCLWLPFPLKAGEIRLEEPQGAVLRFDSQKARVGPYWLYRPEPRTRDCQSESTGVIRSVVGPIVCARVSASWDCKGAAHPGAVVHLVTLDARTGRPVPLTDWFAPAAILEALNRDPVVQKALGGQAASSLKDLFERADGGCDMSFGPAMMTSWAFHHLQGAQVAIRIGLPHGCEAERGHFTELGIYLPVPDALQDWLRHANASGTLNLGAKGHDR